MSELSITMATGPYDRVQALRDGTISPDGIALDYVASLPVHDIFLDMAEREAYDVAEMSLALYLVKRSRGGFPFVALPVFPSRVFRHGNIFTNRKSGIEDPKALEGRRVGIQEYRQTALIWVRGILRDRYGVDTDSIHWVEGGVNVPRSPSETDVRPARELSISALAEGATLSDALAAGELDAVIAARQPGALRACADVVRMFPNYRELERDYFRQTGIFPIMHTLVMRESLYQENPWIAASLYKACDQAKGWAQERMRYSGAMMYMTPWLYDDIEEMDELFGADAWPY
ncbi:MAG: ABC transporter substrate-binding protein, partial [Alphaproteobacteria bacterium]